MFVTNQGASTTMHPGLHWADALRAVGMTQAEAARRLGVGARHLNLIVRGHALPSAALTIRFAELVNTSPRLLWRMRSDYVLDLALGVPDVTRDVV